MRPSPFPLFFLLSLCTALPAHPIPDIPVRGSFDEGGACTIRVEVDPRCFEADAEAEGYLLHIQMMKLMTPAEHEALKEKVRAFVRSGLEFFFEPQGRVEPEFSWEFTTLGGGPLVKADDPVMVTGTWRTTMPQGMQGYRIRAAEAVKFAVVFENTLRGRPVERTAVLFPGESSFTLDMSGKNAAASSAPPALTVAPAADAPQARPRWPATLLLLAVAVGVLWLARLVRA